MSDPDAIAAEMLSWLSTAFAKDPGSVNACILQAAADAVAASLDAMDQVITSRWLDDAIGASLDAIGARYAILRYGDGDDEFRARIIHEIDMMLSYGTVADVQRYVADKLGLPPGDIEVAERHIKPPNAMFAVRVHGQPTKKADWDRVNLEMDSVRPLGVYYLAADLILLLLPVVVEVEAGVITRCFVRMPACSGWGYMQWGECPWGSGEATVTIECGGFEVV